MDDLARLKHACQSYLDDKLTGRQLLTTLEWYVNTLDDKGLTELAWYILKYQED
jgi:Ran GTPase-activating protein (RanGAP) involved in mRNA processing and transport